MYIDSWVSSKSDKKNLTRFALKALTRLMNMIFGAVLGYSGYIYKRCRSIYVLWCLYFPNGDDGLWPGQRKLYVLWTLLSNMDKHLGGW